MILGRDNRTDEKLKDCGFYLVFLLLSSVFIILFSRATSPLFTYYGFDSAIFITLGRAFLDGQIPYVDFFDHKGPVIIFINALGQLFIDGRYGVLLVQVVNLFVTLVYIYKTAKILSFSLLKTLISIFGFLFIFRFTITEGNLPEEYSLPFLFMSIYISLKFYIQGHKIAIRDVILLGFCFFVPFWIRANNVGMVCSCVAFIAIVLFRRKEYGNMFRFVLVFLASVAVFSLLLCGYFLYLGAFDEMIYSTFTFNFKYTSAIDLKHSSIAGYYTVFVFLSVILLSAGSIMHYKKYKDVNVIIYSLLSVVFGLTPVLVTGVDRLLLHYMTLTVPVSVAGLYFCLLSIEETPLRRKVFAGINISLIILLAVSVWFRYDKFKDGDKGFVVAVNELMNYIPASERNEVFSYESPTPLYPVSGLHPSYRYFILQDFHAKVDPDITGKVNEMMLTRRPKWFITGIPSLDKFTNTGLRDIVYENYHLVDRKVYYKKRGLSLYRLNEVNER